MIDKVKKQTAKAVVRRLSRAADLLESKGWTRGEYARDEHGAAVHATDPLEDLTPTCGTQFCTAGAVYAAFHGTRKDLAELAMGVVNRQVERDYGLSSAIQWNDDEARNKRQVVAMLRRAARTFAKDQGVEVPA